MQRKAYHASIPAHARAAAHMLPRSAGARAAQPFNPPSSNRSLSVIRMSPRASRERALALAASPEREAAAARFKMPPHAGSAATAWKRRCSKLSGCTAMLLWALPLTVEVRP